MAEARQPNAGCGFEVGGERLKAVVASRRLVGRVGSNESWGEGGRDGLFGAIRLVVTKTKQEQEEQQQHHQQQQPQRQQQGTKKNYSPINT